AARLRGGGEGLRFDVPLRARGAHPRSGRGTRRAPAREPAPADAPPGSLQAQRARLRRLPAREPVSVLRRASDFDPPGTGLGSASTEVPDDADRERPPREPALPSAARVRGQGAPLEGSRLPADVPRLARRSRAVLGPDRGRAAVVEAVHEGPRLERRA